MARLQWSDDVLPNMLKNPELPDAETHRELKEQLYYLTIDYFDKGKVCERILNNFPGDKVCPTFLSTTNTAVLT